MGSSRFVSGLIMFNDHDHYILVGHILYDSHLGGISSLAFDPVQNVFCVWDHFFNCFLKTSHDLLWAVLQFTCWRSE